MNKNYKINCDLEVYNLCKQIKGRKNESCFYFREESDNINIGFSGTTEMLIDGFISCMNGAPNMYDIISSAVELYEKDAFVVIEE